MESPPIRVLLGSGGMEKREAYGELLNNHFSGFQQVLFVPFAHDDHALYTSRMQDLLGSDGPELVGIHTFTEPEEAVLECECIYVGGGNSFLLIRDLHVQGLLSPIRNRVLEGVPYLGISAGSNVACPTMMTTNDMPIVLPPSFDSLGIVPFQINPHYHPGKVQFMDEDGLVRPLRGETRAQRISEFHRHQSTPVLGMREGSFVEWDGFRGRLTGGATAFFANSDPVEMADGSEFGADLALLL